MSEVAVHAGVGRATLYRHFDTREALIKALIIDCLQTTEEAVAPIRTLELNAKETIIKILYAVIPLADRYHFLLSLWNIASEDPEALEIYNQQLTELYTLVETAKLEGHIKQHLNTEWIVSTIDSLIYSAWWMLGQEKITQQEAIQHIVETLFNGVGQPH